MRRRGRPTTRFLGWRPLLVWFQTIATRLEAIAIRLEAIAIRLEAVAGEKARSVL